ncbi:MAG: uracil-DNA glycosylase, partial [Firmicutes bacterium]|nr:uracil-DNA glycosylase [Bacillota bacterium]
MITIREKGWFNALSSEFEKPYFKQLSAFVDAEYQTKTIYPPKEKIFNAFELTPFADVKAVILGQDPYHTPGAAMGLCFSVPKSEKIPPSLVNIYKALQIDFNIAPPAHGDLTSWAKNGVLLLNTVMTVEEGKANSHKSKGWEKFTDAVIKTLNAADRP